MGSIFVVDDEKEIAELVELYLKNDGYEVRTFHSAAEALACLEHTECSLAILDVMLPDMSGFALCQRIREQYVFPIIMLTAKVEDMDKILGLTLGADDYMTKPFNPLELLARVKTQLRRYTRYNTAHPAETARQEHDFSGLYICRDSRKCQLFGEDLPLTPMEFDILWYLCEHRGKVVSSEELFEAVWKEKYMDNNNTVMAHIARLREKMREPRRKPRFIMRHFFAQPLRYLDEVVAAAERLAAAPEEPITLSPAMRDTQNELNLVREKALYDARAARDAEQRKNDLVVYLAHDLKTPLTSVIGYLTLLRDEPELSREPRARYTGIALEKAERLEELINEFFEITRFSLSSLELNEQTVNLTRMLEQISFEFQPLLGGKSLRWDMHLAPEVEILCDPDKLERVFDNLFRNAVSYSYPETEILVSLEEREHGAVVRVKNRGRTIPPEKLSRIFEQFFRLDSSRATATGGAGLGLAIAREIVERHGGTISAESAEESITFTVTLPRKRQKNV